MTLDRRDAHRADVTSSASSTTAGSDWLDPVVSVSLRTRPARAGSGSRDARAGTADRSGRCSPFTVGSRPLSSQSEHRPSSNGIHRSTAPSGTASYTPRDQATRAPRRATARATGSSTRGSGRRSARRDRRCRLRRPSRSRRDALRAAAPRSPRPLRGRARDRRRGLSPPGRDAARRRRPRRPRRAARSTHAVSSASRSGSTWSAVGPALVPADRVEQRVLIVLRGALGPLDAAGRAARSTCRWPASLATRRRRHRLGLRRGSDFGAGLRRAAPRVASDAAVSSAGALAPASAASEAASAWPARIRANSESTSASVPSAPSSRSSASSVDRGVGTSISALSAISIATTSTTVRRVAGGRVERFDLRRDSAARSNGSVRSADRSATDRASTCASASVASRNVRFTVRYASSRRSRPTAQLLDLRLQQRAPPDEIGEHALARRLRLVEHLPALARAPLRRSPPTRRRPRSRTPRRAPRRRRAARRRASALRPRRSARVGLGAMRSAAARGLVDHARPRAPRPSCGSRRPPRGPNGAGGRSPRRARRAAPARSAARGCAAAPRARRSRRGAPAHAVARRDDLLGDALQERAHLGSENPRTRCRTIAFAISSGERCGVLSIRRCRRSDSVIGIPPRPPARGDGAPPPGGMTNHDARVRGAVSAGDSDVRRVRDLPRTHRRPRRRSRATLRALRRTSRPERPSPSSRRASAAQQVLLTRLQLLVRRPGCTAAR